jgi:hypothetical protein
MVLAPLRAVKEEIDQVGTRCADRAQVTAFEVRRAGYCLVANGLRSAFGGAATRSLLGDDGRDRISSRLSPQRLRTSKHMH